MRFLSRNPKIFCIGFNKTGTTSLHTFFQRSGLRSTHNTEWTRYSYLSREKRYFYRYQAFSDGEKPDFVRLNNWFPDALFILNTRDERAWVRSRIKHTLRWSKSHSDTTELLKSERLGWMAKVFFADPKYAITTWIMDRRIYEKQARAFFSDCARFKEIDVTSNTDWQNDLATFMEGSGVRLSKTPTEEIVENKLDESMILDSEQLDQYYALADEIGQWL